MKDILAEQEFIDNSFYWIRINLESCGKYTIHKQGKTYIKGSFDSYEICRNLIIEKLKEEYKHILIKRQKEEDDLKVIKNKLKTLKGFSYLTSNPNQWLALLPETAEFTKQINDYQGQATIYFVIDESYTEDIEYILTWKNDVFIYTYDHGYILETVGVEESDIAIEYWLDFF